MIYKIQFDSPKSINDLFKKLESLGDFIYKNEVIHLSTNKSKKFIQTKLKSIVSDIFIVDATIQNSIHQPENVKEWIKIRLFQEEKLRFEKENQEALKELNDLITEVENELVLQSTRKEVNDATAQENNTT